MKMANWNKLNRDFEATLESLTDEQFALWKGQRELKKKMRRAELEMLAKIQEQKIAIGQFSGIELLNISIESSALYLAIFAKNQVIVVGESTYAMAA